MRHYPFNTAIIAPSQFFRLFYLFLIKSDYKHELFKYTTRWLGFETQILRYIL